MMCEYCWFGNVCELRNVVECVVVYVWSDFIELQDFVFLNLLIVSELLEMKMGWDVYCFMLFVELECEYIVVILDSYEWNKSCMVVILGIE